MTAEALLNHVAQGGFFIIFLVVLARATRQPTPANVLASIFFGLAAALVSLDWLQDLSGRESAGVAALQSAILLIWPYPLLRLAHEFTSVHRVALRAAEAGVAVSLLTIAMNRGGDVEGPIAVVLVAYFVGTVIYASLRFVQGARHRHGLPKRRLIAAAVGSGLLAVLVLFAIPAGIHPEGPWSSMATLSGLLAGMAYFLAFAPPPWLRRAWLASDLQEFVVETILASPRDPSRLDQLARTLEASVTYVMGAPAVVLVPDAETGFLAAPSQPDAPAYPSPGTTIAFRCYQSQRPVFVNHPETRDPENAEAYREAGAAAVLVAPVTLQGERFGVLALVVERTPMFADGDLQILQVLASQVAVILRDRELLNDAAEAAAQQEAVRLKEDFLSAAAHDLKTPLTTLLAQSQLMQRYAVRDPDAPADREGIERMVTEAQRMRRLVSDLLDASRADQTGFVGTTRPVDLLLLARETIQAMGARARRVAIEGDSCVVVVDRDRMAQVLENLLDNALKYSPGGGTVRVAIQADGEATRMSVTDFGVGIPHDDLAQIFDRFQRGSSVDERRFSGLGLGLYLCRRIVEEHGGTISVTSVPDQGSTFEVTLPHGDSEGE